MAFLRKFNMDLRSAARCGIHWTPGMEKSKRIMLGSPLNTISRYIIQVSRNPSISPIEK
jgi:hypothetical protein